MLTPAHDNTRVCYHIRNKSTRGSSTHLMTKIRTTNCSKDSSNSSLLTPTPPGCSAGERGFFTTISQSDAVFRPYIGQRTVFHKEIDVDLLQRNAHAGALDIGEHDKLGIRRRLVVMKLILAGCVGHEASSRTASVPVPVLC